MELSVVYAGWAPTPVQQELAKRAEEAGFFRLWTTEGMGSDGLLKAMSLGLATSTIRIGTGIAYSFPRSPFQAAAGAAVLAEALDGRFTLGLGAGTRGLRRWFGVEEDHPAPRFGEYVDLIRGAWQARGAFEFAGRFFTARVPDLHFNANEDILDALEVHGSGVNRIILQTSAEHCHGVAMHPLGRVQPLPGGHRRARPGRRRQPGPVAAGQALDITVVHRVGASGPRGGSPARGRAAGLLLLHAELPDADPGHSLGADRRGPA